MEHFEEASGGREGLIEVLEYADLNEKQELFLNLLADPKRKGDNLTTLARDAGLMPAQILQLFKSASNAKATVAAMTELETKLPAIARDIASKALDEVIQCPDCFGILAKEGVEPCMNCQGRGVIMRFSSIDHAKLALEAVGITKKSGGPAVNVQMNQAVQVNPNPGNFFSKFVTATDKPAYDVIDAKVEE